MTTWLALFILAFGSMLLVSNESGMIAGLDETTFGYLVLWLALLVYLLGGLMSRYGGRANWLVRDAVTWLALGLALVTAYSYKEDIAPLAARVVGELLPGTAMTVEQSAGGVTEIRIRKRLDGHFNANVEVNGKAIAMIVDTGASTIVLRPEDAVTANGGTVAARIRLDTVSIGPLDRKNVDALVAQHGAMTESLLGMSFLSRLRSYEFSGDFLTLRG